MSKIKVTTFGSMGWMPINNRHTCCYCLEHKDSLILLDAGTGVVRLGESRYAPLLEKYEKVYVILSHYHFDHLSGLIYLPLFLKGKEVHFAGPGKPIYNGGVKEILNKLISPPYFSQPIADFPMDVHFHDLGTGSADIAGLAVETVLQEHSDPTLGIKVEDSVCYCTDTACMDSTIAFAKDCRILMHESWFDGSDYRKMSRAAASDAAAQKGLATHSHVEWVANAALEAGVGRLMLIHLNPSYEEDRLEAMERQAQMIFPKTRLAQEG
jgi:ribonuclease BN (tRNA processing enzyme)